VFSFNFGVQIMRRIGMVPNTIRAGFANLFISEVFCETLAGVTGATIELFNTDGALGAARGAGIGSGIYSSTDDAFSSLELHKVFEPKDGDYQEAYGRWRAHLNRSLDE
jgi:xylulokinase